MYTILIFDSPLSYAFYDRRVPVRFNELFSVRGFMIFFIVNLWIQPNNKKDRQIHVENCINYLDKCVPNLLLIGSKVG